MAKPKSTRSTRTRSAVSNNRLIQLNQLSKDKIALGRRIKELELQVADLKSINALYQESEVTTPSQKAENERVRREFDRLVKQESDLGTVVYGVCQAQIARGEHEGMSLVAVIRKYIGAGQQQYELGYSKGYNAAKAEGERQQ